MLFRNIVQRLRGWVRLLWRSSKVPSTSDPTCKPPQDSKSLENDVPHENDSPAKDQKEDKKHKPKSPRKIGGRRSRPPSTMKSRSLRLPVSRPELLCRKIPGSWQWEIILSADDECQLVQVCQCGKLLTAVNGEFSLSSLSDRLSLVFEDSEQSESLFDGKPLIFKLRNGWVGDGRKVAGITDGYFIVITPNKWKRVDCAPVEPESCTDTDFIAHYFFRDRREPAIDIGGFQECDLASLASGFDLIGEHVFDDSDNGDLYVNSVPSLDLSSSVAWVRVGEEENGWKGKNLRPSETTLAEALGGRQGRFFIRVYDSEVKLLNSEEFRYFQNLKEIRVNGAPYTDQTILVPSPSGHPPTEVCFISIDGAAIHPTLSSKSTYAEVNENGLVVKPHLDGDKVSCVLQSGTNQVGITLNLPRVWWRMIRDGHTPDEWQDTSLTMAQEDFREQAYAGTAIHLQLPQRLKSIHVGFSDEFERVYPSTANNCLIPLSDFVDYRQINHQLDEDVSLNIKCGGAVCKIIQVYVNPTPSIISFTCKPLKVSVGKPITLHWITQNTEIGGVEIRPDIGIVEPNGSLKIALLKTTTYTLRLTASSHNVTETVTAIVDSLQQTRQKPIAWVKRVNGRWRLGKGFSYGEFQASGLTVVDALHRSISIDKRRRSTHQINIETIRRLGNV